MYVGQGVTVSLIISDFASTWTAHEHPTYINAHISRLDINYEDDQHFEGP